MKSIKIKKLLEWISLFFVLLVAVIFIAFGQVADNPNNVISTTFTTLGSLLLSATSMYTGSRLQEQRSRKRQKEEIRLRELSEYKSFIIQLGRACNQFAQLAHEKNINIKDALILEAKEKLKLLIQSQPSILSISDTEFQNQSKKTLNSIIKQCQTVINTEHPNTNKLEKMLIKAQNEIAAYEKGIEE